MLEKALSLIIRIYQLVLSPALHLMAGPGQGCRFEPSCSAYSRKAIETHGALKGLILAVGRFLRCNPYTNGGYDPVPNKTVVEKR